MLRTIFFALFLSFSLAVSGQLLVDFPPNQIRADQLEKDLRALCTPIMAGRGTGQEGFMHAANYVGEQVNSLGWQAFDSASKKPGPEKYFMQVPYRKEQLLGASFKIGRTRLKYRRNFFVLANGHKGTLSVDSVIFLGYGKENEKGAIVYDTMGIRGKWVMVMPGTMAMGGQIQTSYWREAYRQLANAGVAGMLLCEPQFAKESKVLTKQLEEERIALRESGNARGANRSTIAVVLEERSFRRLLRKARLKTDDLVKKTQLKTFRPLTLRLNFELGIDREMINFEAPNVVAFLPATSESTEWLVVSAHLDHLGKHHGVVYQGADDNGSGSAALLSLARQLSVWHSQGINLKRNIALVWFSGEENGLLGSRYFADNLPMPLEEVIANVNVDMIGRFDDRHDDTTCKYIYVIGANRISSDLHEWHEAVNAQCCELELDYTFNADDDPNRYYFRSDHYNFAKKGIPSMFYFSGVHADYHKEGDTVDKINFRRMAYITELILYNCWNLANHPERPKPNQ